MSGSKHEHSRKANHQRARHPVTLRKVDVDEYEFLHPRCARMREDDIMQAYDAINRGELDVAEDELRWLLEDCPDFMEAHMLLGYVAEKWKKFGLARAHYGYAYELGLKALPPKVIGRIDYRRSTNRPWYRAAAGLIRCLVKLGDRATASEVLNTVMQWDPLVPLPDL